MTILKDEGTRRLKEAAAAKGGVCLSAEYTNTKHKYRFRCAEGHEWETAYGKVVRDGQWCIVCAGFKVDPDEKLNRAKEIALSMGGTCLSNHYKGGNSKLRWRCANGHEWEATLNSVSANGTWCATCAGLKVDPVEMLEKAREAAKRQGGICLSNSYVNSNKSPMLWRCAEGHEWNAVFTSIVSNGSWCGICKGQQVDPADRIRIAQEVAKSHGGLCLSDTYKTKTSPLLFRCAKGHEWNANYQNVVTAKTWCAVCAGNANPDGIEKARETATLCGGVCLSDTYTGSKELMSWRCSRGHEWEARYESVVNSGTWCAICSEGVKERLCRVALKQLFGVEFKRVRPQWLKNPKTGFALELDGYNADLKLAFEYQGSQHYELVDAFKMTVDTLEQSKHRDSVKRSICESNGIQILEIPHTVKVTQLLEWIANEIASNAKLSHLVPRIKDWRTLPVKRWMEPDSYTLEDLQIFARAKGGDCLSTVFSGATKKYLWRCSNGHTWEAWWTGINRSGQWCPACVGRIGPEKQYSLLREIAESRGGKCLSESFTGFGSKMRWRCGCGREWDAKPGDVKNGSWCPSCAHKRQRKGGK
jgi:hypothetical protein